ncbi:MAG: CDP-alcohol phosphatidyltransferase family protein, partial [bacterium]|nr:CDP-alcohol phosphatidyltransferase family protein [bacterium]
QLLKSRDVEDPLDLWVHRPAAYALVWAVFRTSITPTHVTLLAALMGLVTAAMWFWGSPGAMVAGGIVLWASAILDDADGMLARAKRKQSESGRALDGFLDVAVGGVVALAAFHHCYVRSEDPIYWFMAPLAIATTLLHIYLYDYFKESYLRFTRPGGGEDAEDAPQIK